MSDVEVISQLSTLESGLLIKAAVGFLGFRVAYVERVDHENTAQMIFLSVCFAAIYSVLQMGLDTLVSNGFVLAEWFRVLLCAAGTLSAAVWWRTMGMALYGEIWRGGGGNHLDGLPSVLDTIRTDATFRPCTLRVQVEDGPVLHCADMSKFQNHPFGPCLIGADGSVALYVTHTMISGGTEWEESDGDDLEHITIVPSSRVKLIETRVQRD